MTGKNTFSITHHYERGVKFFESGRMKEAEEEYTKIINFGDASSKYYAYAHLNLGAIYMNREQYGRAEELFNRGIELDPTFDKGHSLLGTLYINTGQYVEARLALSRALELNYDNPKTHLNFGTVYQNLGEYSKAESSLLYAQKKLPSYTEPYLALARLYKGMYEPEKAIDILALGVNKVDAAQKIVLQHHLATLYIYVGHLDKATFTYEKLLSKDPHNIDYLEQIAHVHLRAWNLDKAEEYTIKAINLALKKSSTEELIDQAIALQYSLGIIYINQGANDKAIAIYEKLLKEHPDNIDLINNIGKTYRDILHFDRAAEVLEKGLFIIDNPTKAIAPSLDQLFQLPPEITATPHQKAILLLNLGKVYASQDKLQEALEVFVNANTIEPENSAIIKSSAALMNLVSNTLYQDSHGHTKSVEYLLGDKMRNEAMNDQFGLFSDSLIANSIPTPGFEG